MKTNFKNPVFSYSKISSIPLNHYSAKLYSNINFGATNQDKTVNDKVLSFKD